MGTPAPIPASEQVQDLSILAAPHHDTWSKENLPIPQVQSGGLRNYLNSSDPTRIIWKNDPERPESLIFKFAERGVPRQVIKWSGWMGNIGEHRAQLPELAKAFCGLKGFHLFNGVQMHDLDSGQILPSISDVPLALKRAAIAEGKQHETVLIGLIPKVEEVPRYVDGIGLVMRVNTEKNFFTSVAQEQDVAEVLQPDVNGISNWSKETEEAGRLSRRLLEKGWPVTLVIFGGRVTEPGAAQFTTVEEELLQWSAFARRASDTPGGAEQPKLNILLLKGSGGVADKYASDAKWLAENPSVKVVDLNVHSIRDQLNQLGLSCKSNQS